MPAYKATVIGENFEFEVDNELQLLEFEGTVFVEAHDDNNARESALAVVREALRSQSLLEDDTDQYLIVDAIQQVDVLASKGLAGDLVWYFPVDDYE